MSLPGFHRTLATVVHNHWTSSTHRDSSHHRTRTPCHCIENRFHKALRAKVTLSDGASHEIEGVVKGFIPLRNRRSGKNTTIGEGMTEYTLDGERVGYGLSEYLDQPADLV